MNWIKAFFLLIVVISLSCEQPQKAVKTMDDGYWDIDGIPFYYRISGTGEPVIVLHGGPGLSHKYLFPQIDTLLSDNVKLIFYDQRASGWTGGMEDTNSLTMDVFVEDLEKIRIKLGLEKLNLMGHSFGGLLAMYYGIKYPERVNSMVLVDSDAASWELRTPYQIQTIRARLTDADWKEMEDIEKAGAFINKDPVLIESYFRVFLKSYFANPGDVAQLELGFDKKLVEKNETTSKHLRDNLAKYDIHKELKKITCPVLVMIGRQSIFSVEGAGAIQASLPNSELMIFEDCGHFEYIEQPTKFKTAVEGFYKKVK
jgi:proline iminopeptidase